MRFGGVRGHAVYMKRQPDRAFVRVDGGAEGRLRHQHLFAADLLLM